MNSRLGRFHTADTGRIFLYLPIFKNFSMTVQERARDLVNKFSVQYALLAAEEIESVMSDKMFDLGEEWLEQIECKYWQQVRNEINKL